MHPLLSNKDTVALIKNNVVTIVLSAIDDFFLPRKGKVKVKSLLQ